MLGFTWDLLVYKGLGFSFFFLHGLGFWVLCGFYVGNFMGSIKGIRTLFAFFHEFLKGSVREAGTLAGLK